MSGNGPEDKTPGRMPWEPEQPAAGSTPPEPPAAPGTGWTPPSPTGPTTVWSPAPQTPPPTPPAGEPAATPPLAPPPAGQGALLSSAPVGWAPPPPAAVEIAPGLTFADTGTRVIAYFVDLILLAIVASIVVAIVGVPTTTFTDAGEMTGISSSAGSLSIALIGMLYFVVSWSGGRRATIGQRIFNIQVGNAFDGKALSLEQAIRRWLGLGSWIGLFGVVPNLIGATQLIELVWVVVLLITTATSPTKQGLHDRFANTALVSPAGQGVSGLAKACLVIVVVLFLLGVLSIVALILLGSQVSTILSRIGDSI